MQATRPFLVGIAGSSGTGKSRLADRLQGIFGKESERLSLDWFYRDRSHLSPARRARVNFDHPRAMDWELFKTVLREWAAGRGALVPGYDFSAHARRAEAIWREPKRLILVDGLWVLRSASVRRLLDYKIFLHGPDALCWERRLARDTAQRGRSAEAVREQFFGRVLKMAERFVAPQRRWADLVLASPLEEEEVEALADRLKEFLRAEPRGRER